jgi:chromosome segregation ATPase
MKKINAQDLEMMASYIEKGKALLGKAEGRLENLEQQQKRLHEEINQLGVEPENLREEIIKIDELISQKVEEFHKLLPIDFIKENS